MVKPHSRSNSKVLQLLNALRTDFLMSLDSVMFTDRTINHHEYFLGSLVYIINNFVVWFHSLTCIAYFGHNSIIEQ